MSDGGRVEENNEIVQKCKKTYKELQEEERSILDLAEWHLGLIELFLIDISKSLAVSADAEGKDNKGEKGGA